MKEQFQEILEYIKSWIETGEYKNSSPTFDKDSGLTIVDFVADYFLPDPNPLDEEEFNITEIPLSIYIDSDLNFKVEFNKPLFDFYFKGYETEENISAVKSFMEFTDEQGFKMSS